MPIIFLPICSNYEDILKLDLKTFNSINEPEEKSAYRCGLGSGMGSISYDGSIYGCQEQDSKTDKNIFYLGNIFTGGIEKVRQEKLIQKYTEINEITCEDETECENCCLKRICLSQHCPSSGYDIFNSFSIMSKTSCKWKQFLFYNCCELMKIMVEENNLLFKNFLDNYCNFKNYLMEDEKNG